MGSLSGKCMCDGMTEWALPVAIWIIRCRFEFHFRQHLFVPNISHFVLIYIHG